jgi:hypothetical protein
VWYASSDVSILPLFPMFDSTVIEFLMLMRTSAV